MKMLRVVGHLIVLQFVSVRFGVSSAMGVVPVARHVIHNRVHVNSDTDFVASRGHVDELLFRAGPRDPQVRNRLITFPPWPVVDHQVLLQRRHL